MRSCTICFEDKPLVHFSDRTFCRLCYNKKRRSTRTCIEPDIITLEKLITNLNTIDKIDTIDRISISINLIDRIKLELEIIQAKKLILRLPLTIAEPAYYYFKTCSDLGMSVTRIQNQMYAKYPEDEFKADFGIERSEFIKVSHELSFLIDYIRCLKDAYNQFIEDYNFGNRRHNPDFEKIEDIKTFYNFTTNCIEMSDNPLKLDQLAFLRKLKDETQNHHGLTYFHQKHYFDRWYCEFGINDS